MFKKQILVAAIAVLGLTAGAMAQEKRNEISIYGDMSSTSSGGTSTNMSLIQWSYGKYLTPNVVGKINYMIADADGSKITDLGLGARYYFKPAGKQGEVVPFVGAGIELITMSSGGSSSSGNGFSFEGGVAMFVSESTSVDIKAYSQSLTVEGTSVNRTGVNVGTTYRF